MRLKGVQVLAVDVLVDRLVSGRLMDAREVGQQSYIPHW
jgi:hypothetical protein